MVERMLAPHCKLVAVTIPADEELYQRQIEATDRQIDALVYKLTGEEYRSGREPVTQNLVERRRRCPIYSGVPKMVGQST
jgi:hypothetical protein